MPQSTTTRHAAIPGPILLLLLLLLALSNANTAAAGEKSTIEGVLHVHNGATPSSGTETIALEELWRVGGDDEEILFGLVAQALVDDDNNVYLLDSQLSQVEVFTADGEHLKTLGRQGEGPGEFNAAFDMVFMPDGTLGVSQSFPGKLIKLNLDGTPAGTFQPTFGDATTGGFLALVNSLSAGGNLVLAGLDITFDQATFTQVRRNFVASFDDTGKPKTTYVSVEKKWELRDFTLTDDLQDAVWGRLDVGDDGKVVCGIPRNEYTLTVFNPDGTVDRVIHRECESWRRNDKARARMAAQNEGVLRQFPPGADYEIDDFAPIIASLDVRDDGSIWVMTSESQFTAAPGDYTFDVFSPEGDYVKRITLQAEGSADDDLLVAAKEGLVFQITGFWDALTAAIGGQGSGSEDEGEDDAPMEVVCYRSK
jgi:hypothetical protein